MSRLAAFGVAVALVVVAAVAHRAGQDMAKDDDRLLQGRGAAGTHAAPPEAAWGDSAEPGSPALPFAAPRPPEPGDEITIELSEPPATHYAAARPDGGDALYADLIAALGRDDVTYDADLARAARELAYQYSVMGAFPPSDGIEFLVHASGAVDSGLTSRITRTSSDDRAVLEGTLERVFEAHTPGPGLLRVGIGEVYDLGAERARHVGILVSRRQIEVAPAPRRVEPGAVWRLRGSAPPALRTMQAHVLYPDGRTTDLAIALRAGRFTLEVPAGEVAGTLYVDVQGEAGRGPTKLLQVPIAVGIAPPDRFETRAAPPEDGLTTIAEAEAHALGLLNADRRRFGLPALRHDERLTVVAREHSEDMRDAGFFAHVSERTGDVADRLRAAGYAASSFAENLAHNPSLHDAQAALLRSVGHRQNILDDSVTHVGVGLARVDDGDRVRWFLTQVFARPVRRIDPDRAAASLRRRIDAAREAEDARPLIWDRALDEVAYDAAWRAARGEVDGLPDDALRRARRAGLLKGAANAWVAGLYDVDEVELPPVAASRERRRVGVAVAQSAVDERGRIGVALIFAE